MNTFKRYTERGVGTAFASVGNYTVGAGVQTTIVGLSVANVSTSSIEVDVVVNDGVNQTYIVRSAPVPLGSALVAVGSEQKLILEPGDSVEVKSSDASSADVILSVLEIT